MISVIFNLVLLCINFTTINFLLIFLIQTSSKETFKFIPMRHTTLLTFSIYIDPTKIKLAENTIKTQGALFWNSLDVSLKNSPSVSSFKTNLKRRLVSCYDSNLKVVGFLIVAVIMKDLLRAYLFVHFGLRLLM